MQSKWIAPCILRDVTRRQTLTFLASTILVLPAVLLLDAPGISTQLVLGLTVLSLLAVNVAPHRDLWTEVVAAILLATAGEVVLSMVLGIYRYRSGGIPFYVPPGHGVMYLLAVQCARHLEGKGRLIARVTFGAGSIAAIAIAIVFRDFLGLAGWIAILAIAWRSGRSLLIATCVSFTSVLEIAGTMIGNWEWQSSVLGGITQGNPPAGVAVFYCCLDVLTILTLRGFARRRENAACTSATSSAGSFDSNDLRAA